MDVDSEAHDSDASTVASIKGKAKAVSAKKAPAISASKGKGKALAKQKKLVIPLCWLVLNCALTHLSLLFTVRRRRGEQRQRHRSRKRFGRL